MTFLRLMVLFSVFLVEQSVSAEECLLWKDDYAQTTDSGDAKRLSIGTITIATADVFDLSTPKESTFLHKGANKLHIETKDAVVMRQLLFKKGDRFEMRKLRESERLLRANRYIKDASVTPVELCGNKVNIKVDTSDKWTLTPGVSFGRSGGKNKSGIEIQEHNLFGYGKSLSLSYKKGTERNSTLLGYTDPQLFGSRVQLFTSLQNNSDGKGHEFDLSLPFYELDSRRSWGINTSSLKQDLSLYNKGAVSEKISQKKDNYSLFYGWSKGLKDDHISRFKIGWEYDKNELAGSVTTNTPPLTIVQSYPGLSYEYAQDKFTKRTNFKTMGQIEDIHLGKIYSAGIGLLHKSLGSDDNYLRLSSQYSKGYELGEKDLGFINLNVTSYLGSGLLSGEEISLQGEWYSFNETGNDLYVSGRITEQSNLLSGEQILLGGESGLRGYPKGYQAGSKSALFTVEKRFHYDWYPLHIAKFGAVAFADVGTAWSGNNAANVLTDVGIGLRMVPTRSSSAKTLHLDLAFPLNDRGKVDGFQFLIKTRKSF